MTAFKKILVKTGGSAFVEVGVVQVFDKRGVAFGVPPRRCRVWALEAGASMLAKRARKPKCSVASSGVLLTTGRLRPRPMDSAMSRGATPLRDGVVAVSGFALLNGEAVEMGCVEQVRGGQAIAAFADIGGDSLLAGDGGEKLRGRPCGCRGSGRGAWLTR